MSRFERQSGIIPPEELAKHHICLVGAGAVGRQLGITLAAAGAKKVTVVDFDRVEAVNVATQGYRQKDIGQPKVAVLVNEMRDRDVEGDAEFSPLFEMWRPARMRGLNPSIIFSCVDMMDARSSIYKYCQKESVPLLIDGRMRGENLRLLTSQPNDTYYESTLFNDEEADPGRCTTRSTYYAASILASLMVGQLSFYLRDRELVKDRFVNLQELEFISPRKK